MYHFPCNPRASPVLGKHPILLRILFEGRNRFSEGAHYYSLRKVAGQIRIIPLFSQKEGEKITFSLFFIFTIDNRTMRG